MQTECSADLFGFGRVEGRGVVAGFDGGKITSDAGALLLGATDRAIRLIERFAGCFTDSRAAELVEHEVVTLVGQRVFGIALGYEDLVDHDELRHDPTMAVLAGKLSAHRRNCAPLAGKSTLNRLELGGTEPTRYHRIAWDGARIEALFVDLFLEAHHHPPQQIILDLDATDDPLHGHQEGRFFHGYYDSYCYLPLYIFCGDQILCARLRQSNSDAAAGSLAEIQRIAAQIRAAWPKVKIVLRGDSGFCRNELMSWCEANRVDYVFGLARNQRLRRMIGPQMWEATQQWGTTGKPARVFTEFSYQTRKRKNGGWDRERRVVAKAEHIDGKENPRFVVTSLKAEEWAAKELYEELYCARGEMENRIKEQFSLFADRVSSETMRANQMRLYFSAMAYVLVCGLRRLGLKGTEMETAQAATIRTRLLKIGAQVRVSVRRVYLAMAASYPWADLFARVHSQLRAAPLPAG